MALVEEVKCRSRGLLTGTGFGDIFLPANRKWLLQYGLALLPALACFVPVVDEESGPIEQPREEYTGETEVYCPYLTSPFE